MKYTSHKLRIGNKVLNIQDITNNDIVYLPNEFPLVEYVLDVFAFRFDFEEEYNDHITNNGDDDIEWTTKDSYLTGLNHVVNLDTDEIIKLSESDKNIILEIAQQKYYQSEEV